MMQPNEEIVKFLGEGSYGFVNLVTYTKPDGSSFQAAVKNSYPMDYDNLQRECEILRELRGYPRIVESFGEDLEEGSCDGRKVYKLLLEYASEGSLSSFMDNYADRKLPEPMIRDFTRMILEGLVSIHDHYYVHCDLKPANLLVFPSSDGSYELKISDFGNTLEIAEVPHYWRAECRFVGTPNYMPPESTIDGAVEKTLDLWSLGCLVLEMFTGETPWEGVELNDLVIHLVVDNKAPEIPESVPCDAREFIETCFSRVPEERGSASELLSHRFLLRREEEKTDEKITAVVVSEQRRNSFLLNLKLRIRGAFKKSKDVSEKKTKPMKSKIFPLKPPQFKKALNEVLRLKIKPMKLSDSSMISVQ